MISGDLFILVYSIDNRESFEEVKRLQEQVWESKQGQPGITKVRQQFECLTILAKIIMTFSVSPNTGRIKQLQADNLILGSNFILLHKGHYLFPTKAKKSSCC